MGDNYKKDNKSDAKNKTCVKCGNVNPLDACFCGECGNSLDTYVEKESSIIICDKCGAENPSGSRFCTDCGNILQY